MILVDTNIFCDCATKREHWDTSTIVLFKVQNGLHKGYISSLTVPLLYFYIKTKSGYDLPIVREHTKLLVDSFELVPLTEAIITGAFSSNISDFEDAIQYLSAEERNCEYIITRNKKDFPTNTDIEIVTPEEFIEIYGDSV